MTTELDGIYQVSSASNYEGPLVKRSDGTTEIRDGQTSRRDGNNVLWNSTFTALNENEVLMVSVADPSEARIDFLLTAHDGTPTREPVTYRSVLRLARKGDKMQMSGQIEYGNEIVILTLRKVGD
ncbi:MAG: hypothetical protein HYS17_03910 [Micavibrio aeruginosavorus]|uniref:Lipocalin-like domain-containing protein n=1 Tax=Micavibrio aeruginosavorus TaxID=349221 RepID=A0A7T5R3S8_9BACT|nr:MAG: hypothetical protein HYS17_03910 [Micavibrio aeruginosavorus]